MDHDKDPNTLDIVPGRPADLSAVMALICDCIQDMQDRGIDQWGGHYPTAEIFADDIKAQTLYLARCDSKLVGVIVLTECQDQTPEWQGIRWSFGEPALIVHRLAVHPTWQRQGIASRLMDFAEARATQKGYVSIRLDAYTGNPAALGLYEKRGYRRVGQVRFPLRSLPGCCFEKRLVQP